MSIDFHSHILPGIDDGSGSVEESLAMLRLCQAQGIHEVVLTPHFYPRHTTPERFLEKRDRSLELLRQQMDPSEPMPALRAGAEVYFYPHMSHSEALADLAIEGTNCILVEMPSGTWSDQMYRELEGIHSNLGLTPIVAHVERYLGRFRDRGIPERLAQLPVLVQSNASFFLEGSRGLHLLRDHKIHVLGSDCHNMRARKPNLGPALKRIEEKLGTGAITWVQSNERMVMRR